MAYRLGYEGVGYAEVSGYAGQLVGVGDWEQLSDPRESSLSLVAGACVASSGMSSELEFGLRECWA